MGAEEIKNICVVGAGNMGHQIALSAALAGYKVRCTDVNREVLQKAEQFVTTYLPEKVAKGKLTQDAADAARANVMFSSDLREAAENADLVIEAVIEKLELKRSLFKQLDSICLPHTILATNSSYIVSSKIADVTSRTEKVCNMHFFNPALVMKLVEVVKGTHTSEKTTKTLMDVSLRMGKTPVLLQHEIYGFLVNRMLAAIKNEAIYLLDMGIAGHEDIDKAVTLALGYPMGPFRLMDLTGIDLTYFVAMERYQESGDPIYRPSPVIVEKFIKNEWGRKTGKGFYEYPEH
ncbi:3-hydroxyacyl-CoA dehydrogenase [Desulfosporosinus orientis DSM 765]|uniref:3-hydroxybutyryl-CoA dehydrogenase n=1 Tax=Desulfosporosinus orientis (strain ATCC 19365 / DSM 765 / NCIMB 8382 / VKM B-1628 / Singapore I) TaxID=768706 RepID=G7WAH5_DESOD|nr:3-hydroxyacyl-CoA dehydrogenase family protein [Desulfosporosinus orientis]AET66524.1 3-hydroxyacyl-CoA dehydrogenase [Desulfosporosinus orientis DSM 765]